MGEKKNPLEVSRKHWETDYILNHPSVQIDRLRKVFNLPAITFKEAACLCCQRIFKAQYAGTRKITHTCNSWSGCFPKDY